MAHLERLERAGIDFHAQLVLCPGVNDGEELDRSLRDLASFGPRLISIAGVPVGLTKHGLERQSKQLRLSRTCMRTLPGKQIQVRRYERHEAEAVIAQAEAWQERFRRERGGTFFYLGDEFYLMTGRPVPRSVGLRRLSSDRGRHRHHPAPARRPGRLPSPGEGRRACRLDRDGRLRHPDRPDDARGGRPVQPPHRRGTLGGGGREPVPRARDQRVRAC